MFTRLDHLVVLVSDLDHAIRGYRAGRRGLKLSYRHTIISGGVVASTSWDSS